MMSELTERFRYRFQLWWRGQRQGWIPAPGTHFPPDDEMADPAIEEIARRPESLWVVPIRAIGAYVAIVVIVGQICRLVTFLVPSARVAMITVFVGFFCLWTLIMYRFTVKLYRTKKKFLREAAESSNKSLQPTAGRSDV